jgi:hypothetical protein
VNPNVIAMDSVKTIDIATKVWYNYIGFEEGKRYGRAS